MLTNVAENWKLQLQNSYSTPLCIFACLLFSLYSYALHLQSYRNHVKEISRNFKNPALYPWLLFSLHSYAFHLQSYRNYVKDISRNFKNPARVGLTVLKKIVIFWTSQSGSRNLLGIKREENRFLIS